MLVFMCTTMLNFGCSADIPDELEVGNQPATTTEAPTETCVPKETVIEPATESPIDTFEYKMVLLNREIDEASSRIVDKYAIEFLSCEYSAATFKLFDERGSEIELVYNDVVIETNNCRICEYAGDNLAEHLNSSSLLDSRDLFVITISYREQTPLENITVETTILNREKGLSKDATLMINANIDEITTNQKYIHGNALVKLDSKYYIFAQNGYGSCSHPAGQYSMCNLIPIAKENVPLQEQLEGKFEFVDVNGEKIKCPEGYEIYFKSSENSYDIGLVAKDLEAELTDETIESAKAIYLKYTDKNKNTTILYSK